MKRSRRQALGQHFLASPGILERIAAAVSPKAGETVLEIGAGKGALTRALLASGARVLAVEKDPALAGELEAPESAGLIIVRGDILDLDWGAVLRQNGAGPGPYLIAGNLPYSVSSPILFRLLDSEEIVHRAVFLVQMEFAGRLAAAPGSRDCGPLGILLQIPFDIRILFRVAPGSFVPPPRVDSAVVLLERRAKPLAEIGEEAGFRRFLFAAFARRRKTLANALSAAGYPAARTSAALASLGLDPAVRAERISGADWAPLFILLRGKDGSATIGPS